MIKSKKYEYPKNFIMSMFVEDWLSEHSSNQLNKTEELYNKFVFGLKPCDLAVYIGKFIHENLSHEDKELILLYFKDRRSLKDISFLLHYEATVLEIKERIDLILKDCHSPEHLRALKECVCISRHEREKALKTNRGEQMKIRIRAGGILDTYEIFDYVSFRLSGILDQHGIIYVGDLNNISLSRIRSFLGIGPVTMRELIAFAKAAGYKIVGNYLEK